MLVDSFRSFTVSTNPPRCRYLARVEAWGISCPLITPTKLRAKSLVRLRVCNLFWNYWPLTRNGWLIEIARKTQLLAYAFVDRESRGHIFLPKCLSTGSLIHIPTTLTFIYWIYSHCMILSFPPLLKTCRLNRARPPVVLAAVERHLRCQSSGLQVMIDVSRCELP